MRMTIEQEHLCGVIVGHYEDWKQKIQAVQELSELILVLTRREDQTNKGHQKWQMTDEIADSLVMIEQMRRLYGITEEELSERIDYKLNRQMERIAKEEKDVPPL